MTTDGHDSYPRAIREVLGPDVEHRDNAYLNRRIEQDHQHLKGRLKVFRGCKTTVGAQRFCQAHGFIRNLRQGFYRLGKALRDLKDAIVPPLVRAWEELTLQLLAA